MAHDAGDAALRSAGQTPVLMAGVSKALLTTSGALLRSSGSVLRRCGDRRDHQDEG